MYLCVCVCVQHYAFKCCTTCNRQLLTEAYTTEPIDFHILRYDTHTFTHIHMHLHIYTYIYRCCAYRLLLQRIVVYWKQQHVFHFLRHLAPLVVFSLIE